MHITFAYEEVICISKKKKKKNIYIYIYIFLNEKRKNN